MLKQPQSIVVVIALALVLYMAFPGSAEPSRVSAEAPLRVSDEAADRAKSAENLKRIVSNAIGFATETEEPRLPKTLRELQMSDYHLPVETFINPRTDSRLPEKIGESREEQAQWVEKNSGYVWGGSGRKMRDVYGDTVLAWEKPETVKEGIHIAFADASVRFVKFPEAHEMIRRGRASRQ